MKSERQPGLRSGFSTLVIILIVAVIGLVALMAYGVLNVGNINRSQPVQISKTAGDPMIKDLEVLGASDKVSDIE